MFFIQFDINGRKIGEIGVHNTQETRVQTDDDEFSWIEVRYNVYNLTGKERNEIQMGDESDDLITSIWHDRSDGAAALTSRVMDEVPEDTLRDY